MSIPSLALPGGLLGEIGALIESARQRATAMVNSELTLLFWRIGRRIYTEVLAGERAGPAGKASAALLRRKWCSGLLTPCRMAVRGCDSG
jgi:hypothetical protein